MTTTLNIRPANVTDVPLILQLIRELAIYEKLLHECVATEEALKETLFPNNQPRQEGVRVIIAEW